MRKLALAAFVALLALNASALAVDAKLPPDSLAKLWAVAQELALPGPEHELLKGLAGNWKQEASIWMEPGAAPVTTTLSGEVSPILGGRFMQSVSKGLIFGVEGEAISIFGFDRRHKKYTVVGFDTQGTYYVTAAGTFDPKTSSITLSGIDEDPVFNVVQKYDFVLKIVDKDKYIWSVIFKSPEMTGGAPEFKMLEIVNTRVK